MSKRDPLRELSRKFPTPPEYKKTSESLGFQPDMAVAIIGAAILEAMLEKLIIKKLPICPPTIEGLLFKNRGPLSDLHSKIIIAEAMGLINSGMAKILNSLKAVRNAFAHAKVEISFNTKEVTDEISETVLPYSKKAIEIITEGPSKDVPTNKHAFIITVRLLIFLLDDQHEKITGSSLLLPTSLPGK